MAITLIASYGGTEDNSFVSVVEANSFITAGTLYHTEWLKASNDQKATALMMAARRFEARNWVGAKWFYRQNLQFPRIINIESSVRGEPDESYYATVLNEESQRQMKQRVQAAQCHQALWFLKQGGEDQVRETWYQGQSGYNRGHRFSEGYSHRGAPEALCPEAMDEVRYYLRTGVRIVRGGSEPSRWQT